MRWYMDNLIDEQALKDVTRRLIDPWHKTFARDVVEIYEAAKRQQHKQSVAGEYNASFPEVNAIIPTKTPHNSPE